MVTFYYFVTDRDVKLQCTHFAADQRSRCLRVSGFVQSAPNYVVISAVEAFGMMLKISLLALDVVQHVIRIAVSHQYT